MEMDHLPLLLSLLILPGQTHPEMETATFQAPESVSLPPELSLDLFSPSSSSSSFVILPKVVGGYAVTINQVPYQVSIRRRSIHEKQYGLGHVCGGTIISQRVVCSAAHCFAMWVEYYLLPQIHTYVYPTDLPIIIHPPLQKLNWRAAGVPGTGTVRRGGREQCHRQDGPLHPGVSGATDCWPQALQCQHLGERHRSDLHRRLYTLGLAGGQGSATGDWNAPRGHHLPHSRLGQGQCGEFCWRIRGFTDKSQ